jgi:Arc/MetJ-type ribon-helix-helix transcriptional regulator
MVELVVRAQEALFVYGAYTHVMSSVIPARVPEEVAQRVKELVDSGVYSSRSSLIREALRRLIASEDKSAQWTDVRKLAATLVSVMISWEEKRVEDILLFGSVARGEASEGSDVDVLVLVEGVEAWRVRQRLYGLIYPVIVALGVDVSLIVVDKRKFASMVQAGDPFALFVMREGTRLYGGFLGERVKSAPGKSR